MGKSLREAANELKVTLPLMNGREKGEQKNIHGEVVTIIDYGFIDEGKGKEYIAYITKEDEKTFYFGGEVLTKQIKKLDSQGYAQEIRKEGLPVMFSSRKGKAGRYYTDVSFYPEV